MAYIHTALRIFDEHRSIAFYQHLGFKELKRDIISPNEVNIRMGLPEDGAEPSLELMVDYKRTEPYQIGNGYGHFGISAPNLEGALAKLAANGIYPEQEPYADIPGGTRICFLRDPDGYMIELIGRERRG